MPGLPAINRRCFLSAMLLLAEAPAMGQAIAPTPAPAPRDSAVKAAFLYKFGSFVDWPQEAFRGSGDPLVIGVLGDEAVASDLEQMVSGRRIEDRPVRVRVLKESELASGAVHVLLLGAVRAVKLRELLAAITGPVLVVTQQEGALAAGSVINFMTDGARVRFSVSLAAAEARGLHLSARLLAVAQAVEGRR